MGAFVLQVIILLMPLCNLLNAAISCYGNDKQAVDWFIVYKLPVYYTKKLNAKYTFPPHLYMDSRNPNFQFLTQSLNETSQAVAYTLQQAYANRQSPDVGYIFYNDEKPLAAGGGVTEKYGHTKGVTIFDESTALWLIHSVPKFPPPTNTSYSYPDTGVYYGQHMMCVSVSTATDVSNIGVCVCVCGCR
ncbi:crn-7 [Bugula neritina]|uniref:Crn-7 n=1 Tax=Bugula neritina TaxID=10212 RepID=A0A7J7JL98_BUGNE|nr:crn-7 [Bugula neritina]